jgi:ribosome-binding factor A
MSRLDRINSLLKEVISEVIRRDVKNPNIHTLITVTRVETTKDLHQAKVYISVIGEEKERKETMIALKQSAGFIGQAASKKVSLRFFPTLFFYYDDSVDKHMRIETILSEIKKKNGSDSF